MLGFSSVSASCFIGVGCCQEIHPLGNVFQAACMQMLPGEPLGWHYMASAIVGVAVGRISMLAIS